MKGLDVLFNTKRVPANATGDLTSCTQIHRLTGPHHFITNLRNRLLLLMLTLVLAACSKPPMTGVSVVGFGHIGKHIGVPDFFVNGGWGGYSDGLGGSGSVCCVMIPERWRPGLIAHVKWEECDTSDILYDEKGKRIDPDASKRCKKSSHEARVPIPEYKKMGDLYVHFFPNHQVAIAISWVGPRNPDYPWPVMQGYYPSWSPEWAREKALGIMDRTFNLDEK